ncbi:glutaredoxin 3 [Halothiobacillus sp.]|uniref:glutaredoxin 3 n=1 Tax=Halothiobacillus sp. TaxID=1891311 RepID=UPI002603D636|nr:glutaredoxin 3 [Halothiobacillus sp.]
MNTVTMYSTVTCPYCIRAEQLLQRKGVTALIKIRIDQDPSALEKMIERTRRRTVPQMYIGDTHVGGYDDMAALENAGKLDPLLNS